MGDATRDDSLGRDATRALPVYRRPSPGGIRYASSGVVRARRTAAGATSGGGAPYGTEAYDRSEDSSGGQAPSRSQVPGGGRVPRADWGRPGQAGPHGQQELADEAGMPTGEYGTPTGEYGTPRQDRVPGQDSVPGQHGMPGQHEAPDGSSWPDDRSGAAWSSPELGPEPQRGWFGKRHPDLWVFGGSAIVAAAAMVTAFAAASGATAMGYSQAPQGTATHAPVSGTPVARAGPAPAFGPACISPASPGAGP
jgi:hypothetical protein